MSALEIINFGTNVALLMSAVAAFVFREWIIRTISAKAQQATNKKLEKLKAKLRAQEAEIDTLRSGAIEANNRKFMLIQERQIQALEVLWQSTIQFSKLSFLVEFRKNFKMDDVAAEVEKNPNISQLFNTFLQPVENPKDFQTEAKKLEMYVPDPIWKMYRLYTMRIFIVYSEFLALSSGINPRKFLKQTVDMEKYLEVFPNHKDFLEEYGIDGADYLQTHLYEKIMASIRAHLSIGDGQEALLSSNIQAIDKAQEILATRDALRKIAPETVRAEPIQDPQA